MSIADRIKEIRLAQTPKMSQTSFGEALGLSRDAVNNLERGRVEPQDAILKLICLTYGVNLRWLETGEGDPYIPEMTPVDRAKEIRLIMKGAPDIQVAIMSTLSLMPPEWWDTWAQQLYAELDKAKEKGR